MGKAIDEAGKRYGKLLVLSRNGSSHGRDARWLCECDCGNRVTVVGYRLRSGTKSCGCLRYASHLPKGESAFNMLLRRYRNDADRGGRVWELTREQFRAFTKQDCYYCGAPPRQVARRRSSEYTYNGIDRVDNNLGYTIDNCVPCCRRCNWAKFTMSVEQFMARKENIV